MEFSYRVSEQDFREAQKALSRYTWRRDRKRIALWSVILLGLLVLWTIVHQGNLQLKLAIRRLLESGQSSLFGHGPILPISALGLIVLLVWIAGAGKREARRNFLKSSASKGEFAISLTPEELTIRNSEGGSSNVPWSSIEFWTEGADVIVLVFRSGVDALISLGRASEQQRRELRSMLSDVLPRR